MAKVPTSKDDLSSFLDKVDTEARRWSEQWGGNWDRFAEVMRGRRRLVTDPNPIFRATLTIPAVLRKVSMLVESKPAFDIKPRKNGFQKTCEILKHFILAGWDELSLQMQLEMLGLYTETFGCGYIATEYDEYAEFGDGGIMVRAVDPRLMKIDPAVVKPIDLHLAQYLIEESIIPLVWVQEHFPGTASEVQEDSHLNLAAASDETFHKLSWYQRVLGRMTKQAVDYGAIPRVLLKKYWLKDESVEYGYRRVFRTGDGILLNPSQKDQENPYFDGQHPYDMLDSESDLDAPFGHSEVERISKIDEPFNRIGNLFAKNMLRNVPWVIADANALDQETIQDLLEREEVVLQKSTGRSVERVPATMPGETEMAYLNMLRDLCDAMTGTKEGGMPGGAKGRVEVRSEPQLAGLQAGGITLVKAQARRLESVLERLGQKWISRIFQFLPDDQILTYVDQGEIKTFDLQKSKLIEEITQDAHAAAQARHAEYVAKEMEAGRKLSERLLDEAPKDYAEADDIADAIRVAWRKFRFKVVPMSTLAQVKLQRAMLLKELADQGRVPGSMVVEEAGLDNPQELEQLALKEMQRRQQMGFPPPQPPGGKKKSK